MPKVSETFNDHFIVTAMNGCLIICPIKADYNEKLTSVRDAAWKMAGCTCAVTISAMINVTI